MYEKILKLLSKRPELYEPGDSKFWDDQHISKGMLEAHLDPNLESATRKHDFVRRSADWIASVANPKFRPRLLDLGCGPGIYAGMFDKKGFNVTGIDISPRSVAYAREQALKGNRAIEYLCMNYLDIDYDNEFDVVTLIFCDFGVLSYEDRKRMLIKIHKTLKKNGVFIFDACTSMQYEGWEERTTWSYCDKGLWSESPHAYLYSFLRYGDSVLDRYVVVEDDNVRCFNIWNHAFTEQELKEDLIAAGFAEVIFFGNAAGEACLEESKSICAVALK